MKKITKFNKVNLELVRAEVQKAVDTLVKGTGMTIKTCAGGKYTSTTFKFPIEIDLNIGGISAAERRYNEEAKGYELTEKVGDIFQHQGRDYKILGWEGYGRNPIVVLRMEDQTERLFSAELIPSYAAFTARRNAKWAAAAAKVTK